MSQCEKRCDCCNEKLTEKDNYCPTCGKMYKRYWKSYFRAGVIVANVMFLIIAAIILFYSWYTARDTNKNVIYDLGISIAAALIPTALITILNATILFKEHRDKVHEDSKLLTDEVIEAIEKVKDEIDKRLCENEKFILKNSNLGKIGLVAAYGDRDSAWEDIYNAIINEKSEICITATSLKGLIRCFDKQGISFLELISEKKQEGVQIKFILTHPAFAYLRELTEEYKRHESESMAQAVIDNIKLLGEIKFDSTSISLACSAPTVFGIMTSQFMLLNPYPLKGKSYRNLTLVLDSLEGKNVVFNNFKDVHFTSGWNMEVLESFDEGYLNTLKNIDIVTEKLEKHYKKK